MHLFMLDLTYTTAVVSGFICKALRNASKANFSRYNCTPWERKQVPINNYVHIRGHPYLLQNYSLEQEG